MSDIERYRHQCEVRQLLKLRAEHGRKPIDNYIALVRSRRGDDVANVILADCADQWRLGNRGGFRDWRSA